MTSVLNCSPKFMKNTIQESKNTLNESLNGLEKTKSNPTSSDVSTNDLMMSTSVPIKIGAESMQHGKDRIRNTFRMRKSTNPGNKLSSEQSPKKRTS